MFLVPRQQKIQMMNDPHSQMQCITFSRRSRHDLFGNENLGERGNRGRRWQQRESSQHRNCRIAHLVGEISTAQLSNNFAGDVQFEPRGICHPPTQTGCPATSRNLASADSTAFTEKACFEINTGHLPIVTSSAVLAGFYRLNSTRSLWHCWHARSKASAFTPATDTAVDRPSTSCRPVRERPPPAARGC